MYIFNYITEPHKDLPTRYPETDLSNFHCSLVDMQNGDCKIEGRLYIIIINDIMFYNYI